jgi:hypothetical protein
VFLGNDSGNASFALELANKIEADRLMIYIGDARWSVALRRFASYITDGTARKTIYAEKFNDTAIEKIRNMNEKGDIDIKNAGSADVKEDTDKAFLSELEANLAY